MTSHLRSRSSGKSGVEHLVKIDDAEDHRRGCRGCMRNRRGGPWTRLLAWKDGRSLVRPGPRAMVNDYVRDV